MTSPTVSVVIPAFNAAPYLGEAIESAAWQTLPPHEIIIVDDGSNDCSVSIASSAGDVRIIRQSNLGVGAARNAGIAACSGEFIALLDADDIWLPDKLLRQAAALNGDASAGYALGRHRSFLADGCSIPASYIAEALGESAHSPLPSSWFVRRSVFEQVGPFNPRYRVAEDIEWIGRASNMGVRFTTVDEVLMLRRIHASNLSMVETLGHRHVLAALRSTLRGRSTSTAGVET
jgi:glycosyltransferase involved in cell wall biosynthesis